MMTDWRRTAAAVGERATWGGGEDDVGENYLGEDEEGERVVGENVCSDRGVDTEEDGEDGDWEEEGATGEELAKRRGRLLATKQHLQLF